MVHRGQWRSEGGVGGRMDPVGFRCAASTQKQHKGTACCLLFAAWKQDKRFLIHRCCILKGIQVTDLWEDSRQVQLDLEFKTDRRNTSCDWSYGLKEREERAVTTRSWREKLYSFFIIASFDWIKAESLTDWINELCILFFYSQRCLQEVHRSPESDPRRSNNGRKKLPFNRKKAWLGPGSFGGAPPADGQSGKGGEEEQNHISYIKRFNIKDPEQKTTAQ